MKQLINGAAYLSRRRCDVALGVSVDSRVLSHHPWAGRAGRGWSHVGSACTALGCLGVCGGHGEDHALSQALRGRPGLKVMGDAVDSGQSRERT